jgi:hypothetical protein
MTTLPNLSNNRWRVNRFGHGALPNIYVHRLIISAIRRVCGREGLSLIFPHHIVSQRSEYDRDDPTLLFSNGFCGGLPFPDHTAKIASLDIRGVF